MADNNFRSDRARDPLAELARLIGQADLHGKSAPADNGFRKEAASHGYDEPRGLLSAHQVPGYPSAPEQAYEPDEHRHDDITYEHAHDERAYADDELYAADKEYENKAPRVRRRSLTFVVAIFGLAVLGTAGALGYRAMFGGSVPPIIRASNERNTVTGSSESQAGNSSTASQVGAATTGSIKNLVSHEEQPVAIEPPKSAPGVISTIPIATGQDSLPGTHSAPMPPAAGEALTDSPQPPPATAAPSERGGQSGASDVTAESSRAHMAAAPIALPNANSPAAVVSGPGAGYAVQVTSERSETTAQAAFLALQAKYPKQLSGRQWIIRRADLGAKGTYYRALVGPFESAEKAARLCNGLKAIGSDCIVQKN
jgi:hypothetical protein